MYGRGAGVAGEAADFDFQLSATAGDGLGGFEAEVGQAVGVRFLGVKIEKDRAAFIHWRQGRGEFARLEIGEDDQPFLVGLLFGQEIDGGGAAL